jgi:hypothetical protein
LPDWTYPIRDTKWNRESMRFVNAHKLALIIGVVGFVIWLLFHYGAKQTAAVATAAAVGPTTAPVFSATLSYP